MIWVEKYFGKKIVTNKLEGFPKVYYINMPEAVDRNEYMLDMFKKSGITNYERSLGLKAKKSKHLLLAPTQYACTLAHLRAICKVANGPDEYAVILEDDADILVSEYWDFTWQELIERVPEFDILQLFRSSVDFLDDEYMDDTRAFDSLIRFKKHSRGNFMASAYLITKSYAKKLEQKYLLDQRFLKQFDNSSHNTGPVADHIIYHDANAYSLSVFTNTLFKSQIGHQHVFSPYLRMLELFDRQVKKDFTLDRLFTTYESDNENAQA